MKRMLLLAAIAALGASSPAIGDPAKPPLAQNAQPVKPDTANAASAPAAAADARAQEILQSLYGGAEWSDPALKEYFGQSAGYVAVAFVASFNENSTEKQVAVVHITPEPPEAYTCHACAPLLGGAVFAKTKDGWTIESQAKIIGLGNAFGEKLSLVKVGPDKYGVMIRIDDANQGYEYKHVRLVVPNRQAMLVALDVGFEESAGPGVCTENGKIPEPHLNVTLVPGANPQYFDVLTDILENDGDCDDYETHQTNARYVYANGKYQAR